MEHAQIPGGLAIFKTAFFFYKSHIKMLGGLWLLPTALSVLGTMLALLNNPFLGIVSVVFSFVSGVLYPMAFAATILYVHNPSSHDTLGSLYKKGTHFFFPVLWIYLLQYAVFIGLVAVTAALGGIIGLIMWAVTLPPEAAVMSGFVVFITTSLVLTVAVSVYLMFSLYIRVLDETPSLLSMARSWTYIKGKVWPIIGRSLVFGFFAILPFVLGMILFFITMPSVLDPQYIDDPAYLNNSLPMVVLQLYISIVTGLFMTPLLTLGGYFLYKPVINTYVKASDEETQTERKRKILLILSIVGPIALALFLFGSLFLAVTLPRLP